MDWHSVSLSRPPSLGVNPPTPENSATVIVDDEPDVLDLLRSHLGRAGYPVRVFDGPLDALEALRRRDAALLISDMAMPDMSGIELARRSLEESPELAVIILTGAGDEATAVESFRLGVMDYLSKPFDLQRLEESIQWALYRRSQELYRRHLESWLRQELRRRTRRRGSGAREERRVTVREMAQVLEAIAGYRAGRNRSVRIGELAAHMARCLGLGEDLAEEVGIAGLFHEVGMVQIHRQSGDDDRPGKLPRTGAEILRRLSHLARSAEYVLYHHERLDGSGYPEGLRGREIPLGAQLLGAAESFVTLLEGGASGAPMTVEDALESLRGTEGFWYESRVIDGLEMVVRTIGSQDA